MSEQQKKLDAAALTTQELVESLSSVDSWTTNIVWGSQWIWILVEYAIATKVCQSQRWTKFVQARGFFRHHHLLGFGLWWGFRMIDKWVLVSIHVTILNFQNRQRENRIQKMGIQWYWCVLVWIGQVVGGMKLVSVYHCVEISQSEYNVHIFRFHYSVGLVIFQPHWNKLYIQNWMLLRLPFFKQG